MKVWQVALAVVLSLGLVAGLSLSGLAAPEEPGPPCCKPPLGIFRGTVIELDPNQEFFTIKAGENEVTILVDGETKYYKVPLPAKLAERAREKLGQIMPRLKNAAREVPPPFLHHKALKFRNEMAKRLRPFGEEASYDDLSIDSRVVVRTVPSEDGPLARLVLIIEPKTYSQVKGVVSAISSEDKTISILPDDGDEVTLTFTDKTRFILIGVTAVEVGQPVRAVYSEDVAKLVVINPLLGE